MARQTLPERGGEAERGLRGYGSDSAAAFSTSSQSRERAAWWRSIGGRREENSARFRASLHFGRCAEGMSQRLR